MIEDTGKPKSFEQMEANCIKLSNYIIEVIGYMFGKFGIVSNPIPYLIDYKLSVMIFNLLYYEILLMYEPLEIKIDLFRMI